MRVGHAAGLTSHRDVIQHRVAASLPCPTNRRKATLKHFAARQNISRSEAAYHTPTVYITFATGKYIIASKASLVRQGGAAQYSRRGVRKAYSKEKSMNFALRQITATVTVLFVRRSGSYAVFSVKDAIFRFLNHT